MDPLQSLKRVTNIVVLMMENRSFDQMLGYLTLHHGRADVDGLKGTETNRGADGGVHSVESMDDYKDTLSDVLAFRPDPEHKKGDVKEQMGSLTPAREWTMDGFVRNFAKKHGVSRPGMVMGYYREKHLPAYHRLASEFTICDRWFCSVPSWTFPNRLFSLCGTSGGVIDVTVPLFFQKSFFRQLDAEGVPWRYYSHDHAILSLVDAQYRPKNENFFSFSKHFAAHCLAGLPPVTWIDPNMMVLSPLGANDDHPPTSIAHGQRLVSNVYRALRASPHWQTTLFLITYDEHGGFYDHVSPEATGDPAPFEWYGPRVPAFVVSPLAPRGGVCKKTFDHTSIIRTILERFCPERVANMPARVRRAEHLGHALTESQARAGTPLSLLPTKEKAAPLFEAAIVSPQKLHAEAAVVAFSASHDTATPTLEEEELEPSEVTKMLGDASMELTDLQRAVISADYLLQVERERAGAEAIPAVPELSDLERSLIAAQYLAERIG